ncbi:MAG: transcription antitermination factor NusB [Anaerovoracaceae bacterium]
MTRTEIREITMKLVFQSEADKKTEKAIISDDKYIEKVVPKILIMEEVQDKIEKKADAKQLVTETFTYFCKNNEEIDELINEFSKTWPVKRMPKADLAILRTAISEMKLRCEKEYPIIINEAVKMGKKYGAENSYKYINGILGKIARMNDDVLESKEKESNNKNIEENNTLKDENIKADVIIESDK